MISSVSRRVIGSLSCIALVLGCDRPQTAALVEVQSELSADVTRVDVDVRDSRDLATVDSFSFDVALDPHYRLPFSFRLVPGGGSNGSLVIRATGYHQDEFIAEAKLRLALVPGTTIHVGLELFAECRAVRCDNGASCDPNSHSCAAIPEPGVTVPRTGPDSNPEGDAAADGGVARADAGSIAGASGADAEPHEAGGGAGAGGAAGADPGEAGSGGRGVAGSSEAGAGAGGTAGTAGGDSGSGRLTEFDDWARVTHDGRQYVVQNGVYGSGVSQAIEYDSTSFTVASLTDSNPSGSAFPAVYIGSAYARGAPGSGLPKRVETIQSLPTRFSSNAGSIAGAYRSLSALWFSASSQGDDNTPTGGYLEVWYYVSPDQTPAGNMTAHAITLSGVAGRWDVWQRTSGGLPLTTYVRTEAITEFEGDLLPFLSDALQRPGAVKPSWYLTSFYAGFDITSGGVGLHASNISAEVR